MITQFSPFFAINTNAISLLENELGVYSNMNRTQLEGCA